MYHVAVAGTPIAVLGTKLVAPQVLPMTGGFFTVYLVLAALLFTTGALLKIIGRRRAS